MDYAKPLPRRDGHHAAFYDFLRKRELRFQRCAQCKTWRHMPRESCHACRSFDWTWEQSTGRGTVFTWTEIHRALHPGFGEDVPYAVVVIEMEEGVRLVSRVKDIATQELQIGLPVEVDFENVTDEVTLHCFRRA